MAVTVTRKGNEIAVGISETSASSSTESTITLGVQKFRVLRQLCQVTAGTAATVDPILARTAGGSGINVLLENDTAAATCDNSVIGGVACFSSDGVIYHKSVPNAGSDNAISAEYAILVGWE
jgi:hypothetical protein